MGGRQHAQLISEPHVVLLQVLCLQVVHAGRLKRPLLRRVLARGPLLEVADVPQVPRLRLLRLHLVLQLHLVKPLHLICGDLN